MLHRARACGSALGLGKEQPASHRIPRRKDREAESKLLFIRATLAVARDLSVEKTTGFRMYDERIIKEGGWHATCHLLNALQFCFGWENGGPHHRRWSTFASVCELHVLLLYNASRNSADLSSCISSSLRRLFFFSSHSLFLRIGIRASDF